MVVDDRTDLVELVGVLTRFCSGEACGKSIPCRIGTKRLAEIVARREAGLARPTDGQLATDLAHDIVASALCDHERLATLPLTSGMRYFGSQFDPASRPVPAATEAPR
jgi:NADH:ubiquinone oxidoreductase subunit F (NADH-binding)